MKIALRIWSTFADLLLASLRVWRTCAAIEVPIHKLSDGTPCQDTEKMTELQELQAYACQPSNSLIIVVNLDLNFNDFKFKS